MSETVWFIEAAEVGDLLIIQRDASGMWLAQRAVKPTRTEALGMALDAFIVGDRGAWDQGTGGVTRWQEEGER